MNKFKWTFVNPSGGHNIVGVMHDVKKGHFAIHCDKKFILADKDVFDSNIYTFFVDDELCKIEVKKINGKFAYQFIIDKKTNTPLNKARKKLNQKNILYSILTVAGIVLVVALFMIGGRAMNDYLKGKKIEEHGVTTIAVMKMVGADQKYQYYYHFTDSVQNYYYHYGAYETKNPMLKNGFPLQAEDAFEVIYASIDPNANRLEIFNPTENQLNKYQQLALQQYRTYYPIYKEAYCNCVLDIAKKQKGVEGLALFYHLNTLPKTNKAYNKVKYEQYIDTEAFLDAEVDCWQYK